MEQQNLWITYVYSKLSLFGDISYVNRAGIPHVGYRYAIRVTRAAKSILQALTLHSSSKRLLGKDLATIELECRWLR
jgi:hypothetical protein